MGARDLYSNPEPNGLNNCSDSTEEILTNVKDDVNDERLSWV